MKHPDNKVLTQPLTSWFKSRGWQPFEFQEKAWKAYLNGQSGLVNAPTGSGKTYAVLLGPVLEHLLNQESPAKSGIKIIWLTPIRALAKEIEGAANTAFREMGIPWKVGVRTGDTSTSERTQQKRNPPEVLITTPESLHLILASREYGKLFKHLRLIVADEWHELLGTKRGVQVELALSRILGIYPKIRIWGISATIGNLKEAMAVLNGPLRNPQKPVLIRSGLKKVIMVNSIIPDTVEELPWAGHLGIKLLSKIIPIITSSESTLIFTNTRSQAEIWYQKILETAPELAGVIAMHHGSISKELRTWVEDALHNGSLKVVVCTSSLDLGVDFRPVETIIQIGGPKGVSRFLQRAGRSGHQPGALSTIYFVPTHSLELIEAAALREAINNDILEARPPMTRCFDVLLQYLMTLAVSDGFDADEIYREVKSTFCFESITKEEFGTLLQFLVTGGTSLTAYDEFRKLELQDGLFKVLNKGIAMRHRLSIGTIVGDNALNVAFLSGKKIGTIEEWFISRLNPGDTFWFGGRNLELIRIREMTVQVKLSHRKSGPIPSWMGGRMPLSSQMSALLRRQIGYMAEEQYPAPELEFIKPLIALQRERSLVPRGNQFLLEYYQSRQGYHLVAYPFEGRFVHEGLAALVGYRISLIQPITFSIAMNDYGFELLSDQPIPVEEALETDLFTLRNLLRDIQTSLNATEMARRRFRDIASISGLIFKGYPGRQMRDRHVQSSSQLLFEVFSDHEADNLLLRQAYEEVLEYQLEESRLRQALERIGNQEIILKYPEKPTPFAFPIMVDRLSREKMSTEKLEDRVRRMALQFSKS